jgi:phosphate transport system substrate-binding protein
MLVRRRKKMKIFSKVGLLGLLMLSLAIPCYAEKIVLEGSTTVLPIAQKAAEVFMQNNPAAEIAVRGGGSGVGIASLIDGTCDIGDSSRAIKDTELDRAVTLGRNIKANIIVMDGIAIIVHPSNGISALNKKQVKGIFTGGISNWSQVGGSDQKIVVISRDSSSGTFEAFGTLALEGAKVRSDALLQASNQAVASTVARTPGAIGYVGLGFLSGNVKAITYEGVMPSKEGVLTGKYILGRPLFMYTNGTPEGLVKEFIDFVKSPQGQQLAEEEGFVALR